MSKLGQVSKIDASNSDETSVSNTDTTNTSPTPIYRYSDINFDNIEVSELKKEGNQPLAYINYNDTKRNAQTKLLVQSGRIKLITHGIPPLDKEGSKNNYYPDDTKREFIKVPLDPEQPSCVELRKHIEAADEWAGSNEMKKKLFGKKADKYQYQPCIKVPLKRDDDDDDEDNDDNLKKGKNTKGGKEKKEYPVIEYVKMKFNVVPNGKGRLNKTKLKRVEGKTKTVVKANTITEIANEIKFLSEIKFIFYYSKIWANKVPAQGADKIMYGIGFKIMAIEYTPNVGKSLNSANIDFLSEEEEDDGKTTKSISSFKNKGKFDDEDNNKEKNKQKKSKKEDDSEKSEEELSDKKGSNKKSKKTEKNEDEEEVPTKKGSDKKSKKTKVLEENEDDDDEDDEEVPIMKGSNKKSKKIVKVKEEENEEENKEEEEEEIKPKKKNKNKSSSKSK